MRARRKKVARAAGAGGKSLISRQPGRHAIVLDSNIFCRAASINDDVFAFLMQPTAKLFCGMFVEEGMLYLSGSRHRLWHS